MRNSQYFGLTFILAAIAAAQMRTGLLTGFFILVSVISLGLATYFMLREFGAFDVQDIAADVVDRAPQPSLAERVRAVAPDPAPPKVAEKPQIRTEEKSEERTQDGLSADSSVTLSGDDEPLKSSAKAAAFATRSRPAAPPASWARRALQRLGARAVT
ncbi:MAG: hypothetical protein HQL35_16000 [Alphaproteobacteria bacterium]|nr:hypothetical protein [Alphaproteobacteria bacterium]